MIFRILSYLVIAFGLQKNTFYSVLDSTLSFAHLTRSDLLFERKTFKKDSFRLPAIDSSIQNPYYLVEKSESLLYEISGDSTLSMLYITGASLLGFKKHKEIKRMNSSVEGLLNTIDISMKELKKAFNNLSTYRQDSLLFESTYLFADEDDTTMKSKRGILRLTDLPIDSVPSERYLKLLEKVDKRYIYSAGYIFTKGVEEFLKKCDSIKYQPGYYVENGINVYIGTDSNDVYRVKPPFFIFDPGGDDHYYVEKGKAFSPSVIIDLEGNDIYEGKDVSLGGSVFGLSGIWDFKGDDVYRGGIVSIGASMFGIGVLFDGGGNNIFEGGYFSEGAGFCGIGILYSEGDDDYYSIWDFGQGFGGTWGYGILRDRYGDDVYRAGFKFLHVPLLPHSTRSFAQGFAMGFRPDAHGGIGVLYDDEGNDQYIAEAFAQGASYWKSLGLLFDLNGNDRYIATEYAQGAGIHLSAGALYDFSGDDHYFSRFGPSDGEGHDYSVGVLMDFEGNDVYHVSGGLGVGLYNSVGMFCDFKGRDVYSTYERWAIGSVNPGRGTYGVGIFMDLAGEDYYMNRKRKNGLRTFEHSGVFYDRK